MANTGGDALDLPLLLQHINSQHGGDFVAGERYAMGEQGAYALTNAAGQAFVLKWSSREGQLKRLQHAARVAERLREIGYPAPRYVAIGPALGGAYSIQEALPGVPLLHHTLTPSLLTQLLALNDLQCGQALADDVSVWPHPIVDTVLYGGAGFCQHDSLRNYSTETSALLDTVLAVVSAHRHAPCATRDIVHIDFNPANILVANGQITGVIDWEEPFAGDASFDLATLLFYTYETADTRQLLWQRMLDRADPANPAILSVYLAHMILRQIDWSIRYYDRATVEHFLRISRGILNADLMQ